MTDDERIKLKDLDELRAYCLGKDHLDNVYDFVVEQTEKLAFGIGFRSISTERIDRTFPLGSIKEKIEEQLKQMEGDL